MLWCCTCISLSHFAVCYIEPVVQRIREGDVANFTVLRAGLANFITIVKYRFDYGEASPGDFTPRSNVSILVFDFGEWMKNISVAVMDDDIPETDEPFYIVLFNATGLHILVIRSVYLDVLISKIFNAFYVASLH